jgi:hypothetical protein
MTEQKATHRIRLARQLADTTIEVWIDDEGQLRNGLQLLSRLCRGTKLELAMESVGFVWVREGPGVRINDSVTDSVHRVALSLLEGWSHGKRVMDVQTETGLSQGFVSNILAGRQGDAGDWFRKEGEIWSLSEIGISRILEVLPALRGGSNNDISGQ